MPVVIYHNPRCSKSRMGLQLLQDQGIEPEIVTYLDSPPDVQELTRILKLLGLEPRQAMRMKEKEFLDNDLGNESLSHEDLVTAMVAHPRLIERPIVISGDKAVIGRPTEKILEVL